MIKKPANTASQNLVGPQVRRLRMALALSQEALAAKLQVAGWDLSRGGLSKIEAGLRRVNDAELWVLAKVLACPLVELFPAKPKDLAQVLRQGRG
jgi:transcriptional regulator with XRE-family HTH domain